MKELTGSLRKLNREVHGQRTRIRRRFLTERYHEALSLDAEQYTWGQLGDLWTKRTIGAHLINLVTFGKMIPQREERGRLQALGILIERIQDPVGSLDPIEVIGKRQGHTIVKLTPHATQLLNGSEERRSQIGKELARHGVTRQRI
jgi:hypothetical protein